MLSAIAWFPGRHAARAARAIGSRARAGGLTCGGASRIEHKMGRCAAPRRARSRDRLGRRWIGSALLRSAAHPGPAARRAAPCLGGGVRSRASLGSSPRSVSRARVRPRAAPRASRYKIGPQPAEHTGPAGYCVHVPGSAAEHRRSQVRNGAGTSITIQGFSGRVRPAWPGRHAEMWRRRRIRGRIPARVALSAVSHLHMQHPWASR